MVKCPVCKAEGQHEPKCPNFQRKLKPFEDVKFARSMGRKGGLIGGKAKVPKGFAQLKVSDPKRFAELTAKGGRQSGRTYLTVEGKKLSVAQAVQKLGISRSTAYRRAKGA